MKELGNPSGSEMSERELEVMRLYGDLHESNSHKMNPIPVFKLNPAFRD
jgi:hypothetical protein